MEGYTHHIVGQINTVKPYLLKDVKCTATTNSCTIIGSSQRDYALLTETELQCTTSTVTVCPVSTAFYDIQTTTCPLSLYFQTAGENKPCRTILLNHDIPILRRHDTIWIFHFSQPTQVNIR